ncbi:MAG TPA: acyltransferase [Vicinamibacteria bacterium]|nr:acyltransferase [Vicinamibacteria bacterium]
MRPLRRSHGTGAFTRDQLARLGDNVVFEEGVLVFHPETIEIGSDVYVGHQTILKGYHAGRMVIGDGTWIGQQCFFHSAGGLTIGSDVGIGPGVRILTSSHRLDGGRQPILHAPLEFAPVVIEDGADIGVGTIVLPGTRVGRGAQVAAGAVVAADVPEYTVVAGVPARRLRARPGA